MLFLLAQLVGHNDSPFGDHWVLAFLVEAVGAVILGIVMGYVGVFFIKSVKKGSVIVLVTISVVLMISVNFPVALLVLSRGLRRSGPDPGSFVNPASERG